MSKQKVVILDGYNLNPGDNPWTNIESICDITVYDRTSQNEIIERVGDAWGILLSKTLMTKETMQKLPNLKYIGILATGFNMIDILAAKELGITVTNVRGYGPQSVAQLAMAFILSFSFRIPEHNAAVHNGDWCKAPDFSFANYPLMELEGKTLGIFGFGDIGKETHKFASAFGMNVLVCSRTKKEGVTNVSKEELFSKSDFISMSAPLNDDTKGIINKELLSKMKSTAFIINTSRGAVIVEEDLAHALNNNIIAGAAVDVLSIEPPSDSNPLLSAKNCYITPHFAGLTFEARVRLTRMVYENMKAFMGNKPINVLTV